MLDKLKVHGVPYFLLNKLSTRTHKRKSVRTKWRDTGTPDGRDHSSEERPVLFEWRVHYLWLPIQTWTFIELDWSVWKVFYKVFINDLWILHGQWHGPRPIRHCHSICVRDENFIRVDVYWLSSLKSIIISSPPFILTHYTVSRQPDLSLSLPTNFFSMYSILLLPFTLNRHPIITPFYKIRLPWSSCFQKSTHVQLYQVHYLSFGCTPNPPPLGISISRSSPPTSQSVPVYYVPEDLVPGRTPRRESREMPGSVGSVLDGRHISSIETSGWGLERFRFRHRKRKIYRSGFRMCQELCIV